MVPMVNFSVFRAVGQHLVGDFADFLGQDVEFAAVADQRQHDLRHRLDAFLLELRGGFQDRAGLGLDRFPDR